MHDLRFAIRQLLKSPGFTTVAYDTMTGMQQWSVDDQTMFIVADPDGTQVITASEETVFAYAL